MTRAGGRPRAPAHERLRSVRALAHWLDVAFTIPGTRWRVGLDPILGLVPGLGDVVGGLAALYVLAVAVRLGAPASVLARIALNVGVDAAVGAVPLLGDLFDAGWRANTRNLRLLEGWLERPGETRRASAALVAGLVVAVLGGFALAAWGAVSLVSRLLG
jgi:hypothetical protein